VKFLLLLSSKISMLSSSAIQPLANDRSRRSMILMMDQASSILSVADMLPTIPMSTAHESSPIPRLFSTELATKNSELTISFSQLSHFSPNNQK
jgi:hypothetical protein